MQNAHSRPKSQNSAILQLCFCNITEHVKGPFIIRFAFSCLILPFQISTSVNHVTAVVHTSVLTHMAPITARVEMVSGCVQTNMDVTVSVTICFIYSLSCKTSYHQISRNLEAAILTVIMIALLYCWGACQISEQFEMSKSEYRSFEFSQDLAVRCLST